MQININYKKPPNDREVFLILLWIIKNRKFDVYTVLDITRIYFLLCYYFYFEK